MLRWYLHWTVAYLVLEALHDYHYLRPNREPAVEASEAFPRHFQNSVEACCWNKTSAEAHCTLKNKKFTIFLLFNIISRNKYKIRPQLLHLPVNFLFKASLAFFLLPLMTNSQLNSLIKSFNEATLYEAIFNSLENCCL